MERVYTEDTIRFMEKDQEKASIREQQDGNNILMSLTGSISGEITNALLDEMTALIIAGQGITLNLSDVTYLAPSVMEVFLQMERKLEEKNKILQITQMPQSIYNEFKARGMHDLLEIEVKKG